MTARDMDAGGIDLSSLRILEIGSAGHFKRALPGAVTLFNTGRWGNKWPDQPKGLADLWRLLGSDSFDLIIVFADERAPWHWQSWSRKLFSRHVAAHLGNWSHLWGAQLLRFRRPAPIAAVDFSDPPYVEGDAHYLFDVATCFFKRELPGDDWRVFTKTGTATQPSARYRNTPRNVARVAKLRPLPLGLPSGSLEEMPAEPQPKTADIFFAGYTSRMPVRERALAEFETLRAEGYIIDIPDGKIPRAEFYRRCTSSWLTLSPEGLGWDCHRHYEALACRSVPLINHPTIRRHAPLLDGVHAHFFDLEPGSLAAVARAALADKDRLARMAEAGRAHMLANHTPLAVLRYIAETTLLRPVSAGAGAPGVSG